MKTLIAALSIFLTLCVACSTDPTASQDIFLFARQGKLNQMQALLNSGVDVNQQTEQKKKTALHFAAEKGDTAIMRLLLQNNAAVDLKDSKGQTALFYAEKAFHSPRNCIKLLLDYGANIAAVDQNGKTLWCTLWERRTSFLTAKEEEVVLALLEAKMPINTTIDNSGRTLLHLVAAHVESSKLIQDVIRLYNINPNTQDINGWTPLHFAALYNNAEALRGLLQNGADINAKTTVFVSDSSTSGKGIVKWYYRYPEGSSAYDVYNTISTRTNRNQVSLKKIFEEYGGHSFHKKRASNRNRLKLMYSCN